MRTRLAVTAMVLGAIATLAASDGRARLRVTHRDLVPLCLDGKSVPAGKRRWDITPGPVALVFSIMSANRAGETRADTGTASISFTAEPDHTYEVEVRADQFALSTHTWRKGEWKPVVRDRTVDRIVSGEPAWVEAECR